MDNLEDFINKNRNKFDDQSPAPDMWKRIQEERSKDNVIEMPTGNRAKLPMQVMKMAASFLILALAAFGGYKLLQTPEVDTVLAETSVQPNASNEMAQMDQYYQHQVVSKLTQVKELVADESIVNEVVAELKLLDQQQTELLADIHKTANQQELVEALMNTYRMKLEVLQNIINLLEENKEDENISL